MTARVVLSPVGAVARSTRLAESWLEDAARWRRISPKDPVPDVLEYCAKELLAAINDASELDEELSVAAYAEMHSRALSTVRRWCKLGMIGCRQVGREYRIRRGEPCPSLTKY